MQSFANAREAKEYLVQQIVSQAQRDGVSLSETERKMLYFSENYWTLPDMAEVNHEFDLHYDQNEFESKIAGIVRNISLSSPDDDSWYQAIDILSHEDHYLLVLLNTADIKGAKKTRPPGDLIKLFLTAFLVIVVMFAVMWFFNNHR